MPTLALGVYKPRGFTLLELLVVLVILGVILLIARPNLMPDENRILQQEAERMALLLELAGNTAATRGDALAATFSAQGYVFSRQNPQGQWRSQNLPNELRARSLPDGVMVVGLSVQHQPVPLTERLFFSPAGVSTAFEVSLMLKQLRLRVVGNPNGRVSVVQDATR